MTDRRRRPPVGLSLRSCCAVSEASYSSDAPLASSDGDLFDRWPFAERVAHVLRDRRDASSLVVGLYGTWGEGKTTVLNFIDEALADAEGVVVVPFNPWRFGDEATLIRSFFGALAAAVGERLTTKREEFAAAAASYAGALSLGGFGVTLDPQKAAEAFAEVDLEELRRRLSGALRDADLRVVARIDDIDRLDKDEVQAVFRLVKLSADFEHVAYVLAIDPDVVAAALQERYGPGQPRAGYDFLEKIVTVPLQIPPARPQALFKLCVESIEEALELAGLAVEDEGRRFVSAFRDGLLPALRTPRMAKRYGNAVRFALPILAGEVNVEDQLLIEGMRVMYPTLYDHVRKNPDVYLRDGLGSYLGGTRDRQAERERRSAEVDGIIADRVPHHTKAAASLIRHLFPRAHGRDGHGNPRRDQRACSDWYFERFFTYAVPHDSFADRAFADVVSRAEEGDLAACTERLRSLLNESTEQRLADTLHLHSASVPAEAVPTLARAVAAVSDGLSDQHRFFQLSTENTAAAAVSSMIERLGDLKERDSLVLSAVRDAASVTFVMHLQGWASPVPDGKGEGYLSESADRAVRRAVADRIAETAAGAPLHLGSREAVAWKYRAWADGRSREEVAAFLRDRIEADPTEAASLLRRLISYAIGSGSPEPYPHEFNLGTYRAHAAFVDPEDIARALETLYSDEVLANRYVDFDRLSFQNDDELTLDEAFARQFMFVHRRALAEGASPGDPNEK